MEKVRILLIVLLQSVCSSLPVRSQDCFEFETKGSDYLGAANRTRWKVPCLQWADVDEQPLPANATDAQNYCRNPEGHRNSPYCYTNRNGTVVWDYCDVPRCSISSFNASNPNGVTTSVFPSTVWTSYPSAHTSTTAKPASCDDIICPAGWRCKIDSSVQEGPFCTVGSVVITGIPVTTAAPTPASSSTPPRDSPLPASSTRPHSACDQLQCTDKQNCVVASDCVSGVTTEDAGSASPDAPNVVALFISIGVAIFLILSVLVLIACCRSPGAKSTKRRAVDSLELATARSRSRVAATRSDIKTDNSRRSNTRSTETRKRARSAHVGAGSGRSKANVKRGARHQRRSRSPSASLSHSRSRSRSPRGDSRRFRPGNSGGGASGATPHEPRRLPSRSRRYSRSISSRSRSRSPSASSRPAISECPSSPAKSFVLESQPCPRSHYFDLPPAEARTGYSELSPPPGGGRAQPGRRARAYSAEQSPVFDGASILSVSDGEHDDRGRRWRRRSSANLPQASARKDSKPPEQWRLPRGHVEVPAGWNMEVGWKSYRRPDGSMYYRHEATGETSQFRPTPGQF